MLHLSQMLLESGNVRHRNVKELAPGCEIDVSVGKLRSNNAQLILLVPY